MASNILKLSTPRGNKTQIRELLSEEKETNQISPSLHDPRKTSFHRSIDPNPFTQPVESFDPDDMPGKSSFLDQEDFFRAEDLVNDPRISQHISTAFRDHLEAEAYLQSLLTPIQSFDNTMPQSDAQRRALVGILFQAFKSTKLAIDNERSIRPFTNQLHDNRIVEIRLWRLLIDIEATAKVQQSIHMACGGLSLSKGHVYQNFADRFNAVRYTLARNKCACIALFSTSTSVRLADDPLGYLDKSVENQKVNNAKANVIALGKKAKEQHNTSILNPYPATDTKRKRHFAPLVDSSAAKPSRMDDYKSRPGFDHNPQDIVGIRPPKRTRTDLNLAWPNMTTLPMPESAGPWQAVPFHAPHSSQHVPVHSSHRVPVTTSGSYASQQYRNWQLPPIQHPSVESSFDTAQQLETPVGTSIRPSQSQPASDNRLSVRHVVQNTPHVGQGSLRNRQNTRDEVMSPWNDLFDFDNATGQNDNDRDNFQVVRDDFESYGLDWDQA